MRTLSTIVMLSSLVGFFLLLAFSSSAYGVAISCHDNDHDHVSQGTLPSTWYHEDDHPVHDLFRREVTRLTSFPDVGSITWAGAYPSGTPDSNAMPQAWKDALNNAVHDGKIPNIAPTKQTAPNTVPVYDPSVNPNNHNICAASHGCRNPGDIYDAPQGIIGISFDDGPLPVTPVPFMPHLTSDTLFSRVYIAIQ